MGDDFNLPPLQPLPPLPLQSVQALPPMQPLPPFSAGDGQSQQSQSNAASTLLSFGNYQENASRYDEMLDPAREPRRHWRAMLTQLATEAPSKMQHRLHSVQRQVKKMVSPTMCMPIPKDRKGHGT